MAERQRADDDVDDVARELLAEAVPVLTLAAIVDERSRVLLDRVRECLAAPPG